MTPLSTKKVIKEKLCAKKKSLKPGNVCALTGQFCVASQNSPGARQRPRKIAWLRGIGKLMKKIDYCFQLTVLYDMSYYVKLSALSIKTIPRSLTLLVLQISTFLCETRYLIYRSNLTQAIIKINGYLELTVVYDISYYVKLSALSIKTIPRSLTLLVLQISTFL